MSGPRRPARSVAESNNSKGKVPYVPKTTPSLRLYIPDSLSARDKARVHKIDPNSGRCVVENYDEERAVDFVHIVARKFASDGIMESVEWYWNMRRESLNLNTRWNIVRAGAAIHRLFDNFLWVLVPEESIVNQYHNSLTREGRKLVANRYSFPDIPIPNNNKFRYNFIPISIRMERIAIARQNRHPTQPRPNDFTIYTYPFTTMPHLESHVHPKFALLEAGYALNQLEWVDTKHIYTKFDILDKVADIYSAWTAKVPHDAVNDLTYHPPVNGSANHRRSDEGSNYTENRRANQSKRQKRSRQNNPQTPTLALQSQGRQRALKREPFICLSKKSLELHDRTSGDRDWTNETIQHWSEGCRPLRDAEHVICRI